MLSGRSLTHRLLSGTVSRRRVPLLVVGLGLLSSQVGHLLAYWARFGDRAWSVQASGAHLYFPLLAKTAVGGAATIAIAGFLAVGLARVVARRRLEGGGSISYLRLLALLFTVQMAFYMVQESAEAVLGAAPATTAAGLVLWGTLGQLPVALVSALGMRWLLARVGPALRELAGLFDPVRGSVLDSRLVALHLPLEPSLVRVVHPACRLAGRAPPSRSV